MQEKEIKKAPDGTAAPDLETPEEKKPRQTVKSLSERIKELETLLASKEEEIRAAADAHLRLAAEYDNFRKRTAKEKEDIQSYCVCETVAKLLPVIDSLEAARKYDGAAAEDIKKGLELVLKQAGDTLASLGVTEIDTQSGFNPELHDAIMHKEEEGAPENSITNVFQKGYMIGDRVVRHSMVEVTN